MSGVVDFVTWKVFIFSGKLKKNRGCKMDVDEKFVELLY